MEENYVQKLIGFIDQSPTCYHAIDMIRREFSDYTLLSEGEKWSLQPGGKYCVIRNGSSIIAFTLPEGPFAGFQLIASHADSPCFKIKENAEVTVKDKYVQLDTERYGGMIMSSWFDRPLSIAGRALVRTETGIASVLVNLARDMCVIPNVAIHMNREVNNGYKYNPAVDLYPLWGSAEAKNTFRVEIARAAGVGGMLAGQTLDVTLDGTAPSLEAVRRIHEGKTAALLTAPVTAGLILAGADDGAIEAGRRYGFHLGMAFQIVDDLLDLEGDPALMGKTLGKDVQEGKLTWPACVGADQARQDAAAHISAAADALLPFGERADFLRSFAYSTLHRVQ